MIPKLDIDIKPGLALGQFELGMVFVAHFRTSLLITL